MLAPFALIRGIKRQIRLADKDRMAVRNPAASRVKTMSPRLKAALGIALFGGVAVVVVASVVAPTSYYLDAARDRTTVDTFHLVAGWVAGIAGAACAAGVIFGFIWVLRSLEGRRRLVWAIGFVLTGPLAALVWWWRLVRPLPERT